MARLGYVRPPGEFSSSLTSRGSRAAETDDERRERPPRERARSAVAHVARAAGVGRAEAWSCVRCSVKFAREGVSPGCAPPRSGRVRSDQEIQRASAALLERCKLRFELPDAFRLGIRSRVLGIRS